MSDSRGEVMDSVVQKIADVSIDLPEKIVTPSTVVPVPSTLLRPIATRPKILMGTGPTNFSQRVSEALCKPLMGLYMDETHQVYTCLN